MFSSTSLIAALGIKTRSLLSKTRLGYGAVAGLLAAAAPAHAGVFGMSFYTTDYYNVTTNKDTASTVNQTNFEVTIEGILNGSQTVYSQTFNVPFSDSTVQQGVLAAQAALIAQGASAFTGPTQVSSTTTLQSSTTNDVITGSHTAPDFNPAGEIITHYVAPQVVTLHELSAPGAYTSPLVSHVFVPTVGGEEINTSVPIVLTIDRNVITTDTFLTQEVYTLTANVTLAPSDGTGGSTDPGSGDTGGTTPPPNDPNIPVIPPTSPVIAAVPLPSALWPATVLMSALGMRKWIGSLVA